MDRLCGWRLPATRETGRNDYPTIQMARDHPAHDLDIETVLDAVNDAACREILCAAADESLTATEFADACDIPVSTVYRKLDRLMDAGLLEERYRVRLPGRNPREYRRRFDRVDVVIGGNEAGVSIAIKPRDATDVLRPVADGGNAGPSLSEGSDGGPGGSGEADSD